MTVEIDQLDFVYAGDGATTAFPTPFFQLQTDIVATLRPSAGTPTVLTLNQDYTLTGDRNPQGGTLTVSEPTLIPGPGRGTLVIRTEVEATQLRAFPRGGGIDNKEYEAALDKLTILIQQLMDQAERAIHAPDDDVAGDLLLPLEYLRAGGFLSFDATGKPLVYSLTQLVDLLKPLIIGPLAPGTTLKSREQLGLVGDGATDDSIQLVKMMRQDSAAGGATYFLQPQAGKTFFFRYGVAIPSNINLIFSGLGVSLGVGAFIRAEGDIVRDQLDAPYRLSSSVVVGATVLSPDTGPRGGGAVNTHFPVSTRIRINGFRDGADNPQGEEFDVVASTSTSITLDRPTTLAYLPAYPAGPYEAAWGSPNVTEITKVVCARLTVNGTTGSNFLSLDPAKAANFQAGDWIEVDDDKRCPDEVAGATMANRIHVEQFQVLAVNVDGANTVRLNRRLEHTFETAFRARATLLLPCENANVSGCAVAFTQAPTDPSIATFEIRRGLDCSINACQVLNEDLNGNLGPMFRFQRAINSEISSAIGRNPKSVTAGTGIGCHVLESTGCSVVDSELSGCRHNIEFTCSTQCHAPGAKLGDDRHSSILLSGCAEVGCTASLRSITGGGNFAPDVTTRRAVRFGDPRSMVGPYRCLVEDGRIGQYTGAGTAVVEFVAGAEECRVVTEMDDVQTALWCEASPNNTSRLARKNSVESTVNGYAGRLVDVDGMRNGAATRTVQDLRIQLRAYDGSKQMVVKNVDGCRITECDIDKVTVDATEPYAIDATGCIRLAILRSDFAGVQSGISLASCVSAYVVDCFFIDFAGSTIMLRDGGGNTNMRWRQNECLGFDGTIFTPGSPSSGIETLYPVMIT